jgi:HPt (histidine-containing phosphotransfer) domain-containing protein
MQSDKGDLTPSARPTPGESSRAQAPAPPHDITFDPSLALKRCFNRSEMVAAMKDSFLAEADHVLSEIRDAIERGDLVEAGRLGHRLKGTVAYLGAESAAHAALRMERLGKSAGGDRSEVEDAVTALEQQCRELRRALLEDYG